jgi:cation diffusion facilitator CzcD-associated flavoprotein CzcO
MTSTIAAGDAEVTTEAAGRNRAPGATAPASDGGLREVRVAIVGTGFSGLGMAIGLEHAGIDDYVVLERADDLGGTWRDNTYPGAACDVPSQLYSFSFVPNPNWSRTFSAQREIHAYLRDCAERFGITDHLLYGHEVTDAVWMEDEQRWHVTTTGGRVAADVLVSGMGPLSEPSIPALPGLERFKGTVFHSARWDHEHDLSGERVAVIGTGASAIQVVPQIQPKVGELQLYQRTAPWVMPRLDRPVTRAERFIFRRFPLVQRAVRNAIYWGYESRVLALALRPALLKVGERVAKLHLRRQVPDPELRAKLTPDYTMGCKRVLISSDYYPSLGRENVDVVTEGIREIREHSIVTDDGTERALDTIVFSTGFHVTDPPMARLVRGVGGRTLEEVWDGSMAAHLGATISGFPNLFSIAGPNTGLGHTSMTIMIEAHIQYVLDALRVMDEQQLASVDVRREVQDAYNDDVQAAMRGTVWTAGGCASWYLDASGRNTTLWPSFTFRFRRLTAHFDPTEYRVRPRTGSPVPVRASRAWAPHPIHSR